MKTTIYSLILIVLLSCGNEKTLLLPEINYSDITEIQDVSAGYLFYNESKKDSVELNRKNLISTTNWLINVDKRLTLKQAISHIKYLQNKKNNSSHKKEDAKNYFTCNDKSRKNLGFIEFTNVVYDEGPSWKNASIISQLNYTKTLNIEVRSINIIIIKSIEIEDRFKTTNSLNLENIIINTVKDTPENIDIVLDFNTQITFQDYISIKSILTKLNLKNITISNKEYLF